MKPTKKLNNVNNKVRLTGKVNNIQSTHKKLKLKMIKERRKKIQRSKKKAVQMTDTMLTKNIDEGSSENDLNNINHTTL